MKKENLSPQESLQIIEKMIENAKARYNDDGFIMRMWGWLVIFAALGQIVLMHLELYSISWYPWLLMPLGFFYTFWHYSRNKKEKKSKSHFGTILLWSGIFMGINLMILGFFGVPYIIGEIFMGIAILLISFFTLLEGLIFKFRPLIVGSLISNLLAFSSFVIVKYIDSDRWIWLLSFLILVMIFSNLIPSYIIKSQFKKKL